LTRANLAKLTHENQPQINPKTFILKRNPDFGNGAHMGSGHTNARLSRAIQFRMAQREDAEAIMEVINVAFHYAEQFFIDGDRIEIKGVLECLDRGNFLLAESEGVLLGCVYVEQRPRHDVDHQNTSENRAYLGLLSVVPGQQQGGVGSMLMDAAESYCKTVGARFMEILVVNLRKELTGFYQKRGYVETGTSSFPADIETKLPVHFIEMSKPLPDEK